MWGSVKTYDNRLTLGDATALSTLVETSCLTDIYTEGRARFESLVESMDEIRSAVAVEVAARRRRERQARATRTDASRRKLCLSAIYRTLLLPAPGFLRYIK